MGRIDLLDRLTEAAINCAGSNNQLIRFASQLGAIEGSGYEINRRFLSASVAARQGLEFAEMQLGHRFSLRARQAFTASFFAVVACFDASSTTARTAANAGPYRSARCVPRTNAKFVGQGDRSAIEKGDA